MTLPRGFSRSGDAVVTVSGAADLLYDGLGALNIGSMCTTTDAPVFFPNGIPTNASGQVCVTSSPTLPVYFSGGLKFDATGRLVVTGTASVPAQYNSGFQFDTDGALVAVSGGALSVPAGFDWTPPVNVYWSSADGYYTDYDPAPFLVEGDPGVTTYYVDSSTGNDANPGTSGSPKKTVTTISGGRVSKLLIKARGTFYSGEGGSIQMGADEMCVEAWGGASLVFTMQNEPSNPLIWTDEGSGVWSAPPTFSLFNGITAYLGTNIETMTRLPTAANLAACQATVNTYFRETSPSIKLYINTGGASPATGYTIFANSGSCQSINVASYVYPQRVALHGAEFRGGNTSFMVQGDSVHSKVIEFVSCSFKHGGNFGALQATGTSTVITYDCTAGPTSFDCFSYTTASGSVGGEVPKAVEIGNTGRNGGITSAANQGSTTHFGGKALRVNCTYRNNTDQQMADVGEGTQSWNLGCTFGPKGSGTGKPGVQAGSDNTTVDIWLDGCLFDDDLACDVLAATGGTIYYKNMSAPSECVDSEGQVIPYGGTPISSFLLLESGDDLLLESGNKLLLEA